MQADIQDSQFFKIDEAACDLSERIADRILEDSEDERGNEPLWSIDDDALFQPNGLINHQSADKKRSIFITWDENYLITFHFKKSKRSKHINMTKVRIPIPDGSEIREVHILELNTLLLTTAGNVYYFSSVQSVNQIGWLNGVRSFCRMIDGFSVIRHDGNGNRLLLQVYDDNTNLSENNKMLRHSYDITYNEHNVLNSEWQDEHYTLLSYETTQPTLSFLQCILGSDFKLCLNQVLHIFTIYGHVFALILRDNEEEKADLTVPYHIQLLCVYATPVMCIKLLPEKNMCLIFLTCGSIDILYVSNLTKLKQKQTHYTGCEFLDYDTSSESGDFYYTDGDRLTRLRFSYLTVTDDCFVQEDNKDIAGVMACTWMESINQLITLSWNNIFYRIGFTPSTESSHEPRNFGPLSDLTPAMINRLASDVMFVEENLPLPAKLNQCVEMEYLNQQIIAAATKSVILGSFWSVELTYCRQLPNFNSDTILLCLSNSTLCGEHVFARFDIKLLIHSEIFQQGRGWQLFLQEKDKANVINIPDEVYRKQACVVCLPLLKNANSMLPQYNTKIVKFLEVNTQTCAVTFPVELKELPNTYAALFNEHAVTKSLNVTPNWRDLLQRSVKQTANTAEKLLLHKLVLSDISSIQQLLKIFGCADLIELSSKSQELHFICSKLEICFDETTKTVTLTSRDATALLYSRLHLILNSSASASSKKFFGGRDALSVAQIMEYQCNIERMYGTQKTGTLSCTALYELKNLVAHYNQLRKELY